MNNIPTAEEYLKNSTRCHSQDMVEFAKLHVEAAIKAAAQAYTGDTNDISDHTEYLILKAYPLKNIK